jgi:glucosamine-phosphate N-acetyltransferase
MQRLRQITGHMAVADVSLSSFSSSSSSSSSLAVASVASVYSAHPVAATTTTATTTKTTTTKTRPSSPTSSTFANGGLVLRLLELHDYNKGYLQLLQQLTSVGAVDEEGYARRFNEMQRDTGVYHIMVIEDLAVKQLIGAATLFIEQKFQHNGGRLGNIEDVVVNSKYRGQRLGARVCQSLLDIGKAQGCYKVVLDCSEDNVAFYHKLGFDCYQDQEQLAIYFH